MITINKNNILMAIQEDIQECHSIGVILPNQEIEYLSKNSSQFEVSEILRLFNYGKNLFSELPEFGQQSFFSIRNGNSFLVIDYISPLAEKGAAMFLEIKNDPRHPAIYHQFMSAYSIYFSHH